MAEAEAKAMQIKSNALRANQNLIQYEAVTRWNGQLPQIILGDKSMPILDLKNLGSK